MNGNEFDIVEILGVQLSWVGELVIKTTACLAY